jgi:hypothetical protein
MNRNNDFFKDQGTLSEGMHLKEEALAAYVDALLQKRVLQLPVGLLDHVENCPLCQAKILETHLYLRNPLVQPATAGMQSMSPVKKKGLLTWLPLAGRVAAAFFVVTLLTAVYFSWPRNDYPFYSAQPAIPAIANQIKTVAVETNQNFSQAIPEKTNSADSQKKNSSRKRTGEPCKKVDAFAINHNLEFMVGSRSRSFIVEVHSPINNASCKEGIMFSWHEFGREPLSLVILNNRNETVAKSPVSNGHFQFSAKLPPGCYYWKLESANELYYVGKFFIASSSMSPK